MNKQKILIIEDDNHISDLVKYNMENAGYDCITAFSGEDALNIIEKQMFQLIILDIMLPKIDGLEVCRKIRANEKMTHIPVIMLTAKGEEIDRIVGLELGADDYVVKPFSVRELVLRVKVALKTSKIKTNKSDILTANKLMVDILRHKVTANSKNIELTHMEFNLLVILMQRRGRVQSRDRLLDDIWGITGNVTSRTVDTHIKRLRKKLGSIGVLIETVRGMGYRFFDN